MYYLKQTKNFELNKKNLNSQKHFPILFFFLMRGKKKISYLGQLQMTLLIISQFSHQAEVSNICMALAFTEVCFCW